MVWGSSGLKSCDALLQRVQDNDPKLSSMIILPMKTFGAAEVERLAQILASGVNTNLRSISASGHKVPLEALTMLGKALTTSQYIQELSIGDESMGDEGVEALCQPLLELNKLEHVDFGFKSLSSTGAAMIGKAFGASGVKKLEIYRNPDIGDDGILALVSNAKDTKQETQQYIFSNMEFLDISECTVGSKGMEALAKYLLSSKDSTQRPKAIELIASLNPLSPSSGSLLGNLVATKTLCKLAVKKCQLGDEGILSLLETAASSATVLSFLDLSENGLTTSGATGMAQALKAQMEQFPFLTELNLSGNGDMGSDGVVALAKALSEQGCTIRTLDMGGTNCGINGAMTLLKTCPSLKSLRLFDNNLQCEGFRNLALCLEGGHPTLEHLDLGGNRAKAPAVAILLRAILQDNPNCNSVLNTLELGGNQGSDEVEEIIVEMSRLRPALDIARDKPKAQNQQPEGNLFQNPTTSWMQN